MTGDMTGRRMLLVHAHPDDESLNNGATIAAAVAAGARVTLVTCTRGELGEVVTDDLAHLRGDPDALGAHREGELATAMRALGLADHRFLGADAGVRYRDSGMVTLPNGLAAVPDDVDPAAFAVADLDAAAGLLAAIVREVRPHVVITYDPTGGYGHPDHVMAHRVTMRALDLAADDWDVPKVYAPAWPLSLMQAAFASMPDVPFDLDGDLPGMVVPDDRVAAVVAAEDHWDAKAAALAAHRTQMHVDLEARTTTQDDGMPVPILGTEWYTLIKGERAGALDADGRETDLFAGTA